MFKREKKKSASLLFVINVKQMPGQVVNLNDSSPFIITLTGSKFSAPKCDVFSRRRRVMRLGSQQTDMDEQYIKKRKSVKLSDLHFSFSRTFN